MRCVPTPFVCVSLLMHYQQLLSMHLETFGDTNGAPKAAKIAAITAQAVAKVAASKGAPSTLFPVVPPSCVRVPLRSLAEGDPPAHVSF